MGKEKGDPRALEDEVVYGKRESLVKDGLRRRRNSTLATRVSFTDSSVNGISYISPRRSHYSSSRR